MPWGFSTKGVAAFAWIGTDPHAERVCRHGWPDVLVLNEDEKSLAAAVLSSRAGHPYVQLVVIFAGRSVSRKGSLEACEADSRHENDPAAAFRVCLAHKWPSVRAAALQEGSGALTRQPCECVSSKMSASLSV